MTENVFAGEIRFFAIDWAPDGWLRCDGAELQIAHHAMLFSIIGTKFGGDGKRTFRVPDLRDRVAVGTGFSSAGGTGYRMGDKGGASAVALQADELPPHTHDLQASSASGSTSTPTGKVFAKERTGSDVYQSAGEQPVAMAPDAIGPGGEGKPHNNVMPSLGLSAFIASRGEFPMRPS